MADSHKLAVVTPETGVDGQPVYANVAQVSFTPFDFRITFSLLSTPHSEQVSDPLAPTFAPQAVAEVVMPAAAIESLADALRAELNDYVDRFGAPPPHLQQVSA